MKLTLTFNSPQPEPLPPLMNFIGVGISNDPSEVLRANELRALTLWDFTTDLIPTQPLANNINYRLTGWGQYNNGTYTPSTNSTTKLRNLDTNAFLNVNHIISSSDLPTDLNAGKYGIRFSDMYNYSDPYYYYFEFLRISDNRKIIIHVYRGSEKRIFPTGVMNKVYQIPPDTLTPLSIEDMFDNFDWFDPQFAYLQQEIGEPVSMSLEQFYGEIAAHKYLKAYFLRDDYTSYYPFGASVPNLVLNGGPVFFGQALDYNLINSGQVLIDTIGMSSGQQISLYIGIEGILSLKIHFDVS